MFYSHEILTSRKYGVATIWLVATLGKKSTTKNLTRKAILDVDVRRACEIIMEPEAPMALRLQSNLLYGVSRVFAQQCGYVLADVEKARNKIRDLIRITTCSLDANAGKTSPDQLILMDDPAFTLDMPLPGLEVDFSILELDPVGGSPRSSQSIMSPRHRSHSGSTPYSAPILGFSLPSSSAHSGAGKYQLPLNDIFRHSSGKKPHGAPGTGRGPFDDEEALLFQDDVDFEFDAEGNVRDIPISERESRRRAGSLLPLDRLGSDSAASGRVRKEHEAAGSGRALLGDEDFNMMQFGDEDMPVLPDAEPFPSVACARRRLGDKEGVTSFQDLSSESAEAPMRRRKVKARKTLALEHTIELRNTDLLTWQRDYLDTMDANIDLKKRQQEVKKSKENAYTFVFGSGINGVGNGIGSLKFPSPLDLYSGVSLMETLTGETVPRGMPFRKKRSKRDIPGDVEDQSSSPKRARTEEEIGRGAGAPPPLFDDEGGMILMDEDPSIGIELGRDAGSALADHPSSAMPWNYSASLHSHQHGGASSSLRGRSLPRRNTSAASPLIGRGSNIPGELEQFAMLDGYEMEEGMVYDNSQNLNEEGQINHAMRMLRSSTEVATADRTAEEEEEFEIFGPGAHVDTQTAGSSQWIRSALDRESNNFFEYVRNSISEKEEAAAAEREEIAAHGDRGLGGVAVAGRLGSGSVCFEELFDPQTNSTVVAAQAFYHVLALATRGRIWVLQEGGENGDLDVEEQEEEEVVEEGMQVPFGEIRIGIVA